MNMLMIGKNTMFSVGLILLISLLIWTSMIAYPSKNGRTRPTSALPDALMENVTALILDKQGKPKLKIQSPKLIHFTIDDITQLTTPTVTLYRKSPRPWLIRAQHAKATQGIENIHFWQRVTIYHAEDGHHPYTQIKTTSLTVHPNQNLAQTTAPITLIQPSLSVNAVGMHANLKSGNIQLLSRAKGEYFPHA